ncbi:M48 family metallopeptidase [Prevotella sp.]|uniref:M48 family metallopeptidase n=1 Tax=Prevotella sp. TaxID=59823 RepID=UPI002F92943E
MKTANEMDACARKVLKRMAVFGLVYVLLILLGVLLLVGSYLWATRWGWYILLATISQIHSGAIIAIVLGLYVGVILLSLAFGLYLIKYIFARHRDDDTDRIEVTEADCPRLFRLINETADAVGAARPYKVYLTPQVNASAFFNTSIWSMLFPVKKNLNFGLGLLVGMNTEEVRSILAHEFGHFSQDSMRVGETVYAGNIIMRNMAFERDYWDRWVDWWADESWWFVAIYGKMTRWLANKVCALLQRLYHDINIPYMELSRRQEYDADRQSDRLAGRMATESAMLKTDITGEVYGMMVESLNRLAADQRKASPYALMEALTVIEGARRQVTIDAMLPLREADLPKPLVIRRFTYDELWNSHPTMHDRIAHLKDTSTGFLQPAEKAWTLVPEALKERVEKRILDDYDEEAAQWPWLQGEELSAWVKNYIHTDWLEPIYCDFFTKHSCLDFFNPATDRYDGPNDNPFNEENRKLVLTYVYGVTDIGEINEVINGEKEVGTAYYDGKPCPIDSLSTDELYKEIDELRPRMARLYGHIHAYLSTREEAQPLYSNFFRIDQLSTTCDDDLSEQGNDILNTWYQSKKKNADAVRMGSQVADFSLEIAKLIDQLTEEDRRQCYQKDLLQEVLDFASWRHKATEKEINDLERMPQTYEIKNSLSGVLSDISGSYKMEIAMLAQRMGREAPTETA